MSGQDLWNELMGCLCRADELVKEQRFDGAEAADAECKYRIAAAHKARELREAGEAVGMIDTYTRGDRNVAMLKKQWVAAQAVYEANKSAMYVNQGRIRILEAQLNREWRS